MVRQRWGRIVEINALAGTQITPDGIPSVANRAACIAMAKSLGMSLETTFTNKSGRPMKIANSGKVIKELFA